VAFGFEAVAELDEGLLEDPVFVFDAFAWENHDAERAGVWSGGV
jgi:hypothetical protein